MSEQTPPLGSLKWIRALEKQEADLERSKKNRSPRIDEHLNLDETDTVDRGRRARHPAGHIEGAPFGTSTVGESSRGKDPGR